MTTEITICKSCHEPTHEACSGNEGWTICGNCNTIEGDTLQAFECDDCGDMLLEDVECECN